MPSAYGIGQRERLLFLHIPKNAGSSMRLYLQNQYPRSEVYPPVYWQEVMRHPQPLESYKLFAGHFRANFRHRVPAGTRTLVVLRRPAQRLVSALRHLRRDPNFHSDHQFAKGKTLPEIVRNDYIMRRQQDVQTFWLAASVSVATVENYLRTHPDGDPIAVEPDFAEFGHLALETAKRNLKRITYIDFAENLGPLLSQLADEMNYHPLRALPLINEAREETAEADRLGAEDYDRIAEYTRRDEELYRFAVELVEARRIHAGLDRLRQAKFYTVPENSFTIDLRGPMPGASWYNAEEDAGSVWRWTGPGQQFTLDLALRDDRSYHVELLCRGLRSWDDNSFGVFANGVGLSPELSISRDDRVGLAVNFVIPSQLIAAYGGICQLMFDPGSTTRPSATAGDDERNLGVAVYRIAFQEVEA